MIPQPYIFRLKNEDTGELWSVLVIARDYETARMILDRQYLPNRQTTKVAAVLVPQADECSDRLFLLPIL